MFWNKYQKNLRPFPSDYQTIINNIRFLALSAVRNQTNNSNAKVLQATPLFYTLFRNHLVLSQNSNFDPISDKLVVSKNYGGNFLKTILYCASLYERKTNFLNDLTDQNQNFSNCIYDFNDSIPGQALEFSVGLAISNKLLLDQKAELLAQNKIYCIFDQTDLISGRLYEATALAGALNLKNLIWLADFSGVEQRGFFTDHTLTSFKMLFKANRWNYQILGDGSNVELLSKAISKAQNANGPSCLEINSVSGHGSSYAGTIYSSNIKVDDAEINKLKERFEYELKPEEIYKNTIKDLETNLHARYLRVSKEYENNFKNTDSQTKHVINKFLEFKNNQQTNEIKFEGYDVLHQSILNHHEFAVGLMANEFDVSNDKFERLKNTILIGKRTSIVYGVGAGLNASKYFSAFITVNASALYDLLPACNQSVFLNNQCPILVYFNDESKEVKGSFYNLIASQKTIEMLFPQTLNELNDAWLKASHGTNQFWTCIGIFNNSAKENTLLNNFQTNELAKINVLVIDLQQEKIEQLMQEFKKQDFLINLVHVSDPKHFISLDETKLSNFLSTKPYVWVGIDATHWLNQVRLNILNQKIVVKSNDDSMTNLVAEIIKTYNHNI